MIATGSTFYAARACESRRAYSARCVRLVSAPHAALCDSLKLDTSRYLVRQSFQLHSIDIKFILRLEASSHQRFV